MDRQRSAWAAYTYAYWDPADLCLQGGLNAVAGMSRRGASISEDADIRRELARMSLFGMNRCQVPSSYSGFSAYRRVDLPGIFPIHLTLNLTGRRPSSRAYRPGAIPCFTARRPTRYFISFIIRRRDCGAVSSVHYVFSKPCNESSRLKLEQILLERRLGGAWMRICSPCLLSNHHS
jgi:hypothetical protein